MKTFTRIRSIANALRILAVFWILNGVCCFFPDNWDNVFLAKFGVESVPHGLPMMLVLRWAGLICVGTGVVIWVVATDIVRYRPIVITIIALHLIAAAVSYFVETIIRMPMSWRIMDSVICLVCGALPLAFCLWPAKKSPNTALEPTATAP